MRIYLIGMPASGKTTFGKQLAESLSYQFVDMDDELVKVEGKSIPQIFTEHGEAYFRALEQRILHELLPDQTVISTGGGAPCFFDNMEFIEQHGISIFLDVSVETLQTRALAQDGTRPLLSGKVGNDLLQELNAKRQKRLPFYEQATIILKENEIQLELLLSKLNLILNDRP